MGFKSLISRKAKHIRRSMQDTREFDKVGSVTDDKLRREIGSLTKDLKLVDGNYLKFVKRHSRFGEDGGKSEYNKAMLERARTERVRSQIQRYQESMKKGVTGLAVAKIVGHVAINAVFNKKFRDDFLDEFRKPIEKTAEKLAKNGGQASVAGRLMRDSTHVPFDARSAALTELAQTLKFNEDMRNTKDPAKRAYLTKSYSESLNALYDWAKEDGVSADSIRRMRNVMIDKDLRSENPKFAHLYEGSEFIERSSQRVEFFEHMDEGVFVWEGDFKDSRTNEPFEMIVRTPEYGEPLESTINYDEPVEVDTVSDEKALVDDGVMISQLESAGFDFEFEPMPTQMEAPKRESTDIELDWSDSESRAVNRNVAPTIDFSQPVDFGYMSPSKVEPNLGVGSRDQIAREVVFRKIPDIIANDMVEQRFSITVDKANWERTVESLTNEAEKPLEKVSLRYHDTNSNNVTTEQLRRQAEFELVNKRYDQHVDKALDVVPENVDVEDGYHRLNFDTDNKVIHVDFVTRERVRRQERIIEFEETRGELAKIAASTPSITDDQLLAQLELSLAKAGTGASLEKDMSDFEIGN